MKLKRSIATVLLAAALAPVAHAAEPVAGRTWTEPNTGIEFVYISAGCFDMGSSAGDKDELPVHKVCVKGFYLGKYEVTQAQYQALTGKSQSELSGSNTPEKWVSFIGIKKVLEKFNFQNKNQFRLPSEAEWEYACRAGGEHGQYCGAGDKDKLAWYKSNSDNQIHAVGQKLANAWGLYDMSGNEWEWVEDCWHSDYNGAPTDGSAWKSEGGGNCSKRVLRGGSWFDDSRNVRAASRNYGATVGINDGVGGFRLAFNLAE